MSTLSRQHNHLDVSGPQASDEVIKRIRKLRWIGMDDEARMLEQTLARVSAASPVLAFPHETD
jgi:hypothetical protein